MDKNTALIVVILASVALLVLLLRLWRNRGGGTKLQSDSSGLWRYHKETQVVRKSAYGEVLEEKKRKKPKRGEELKPIAVLTFDGDLRAKQHESFADLVDEIEINRDKLSEVVVVINSPGGMVSQYGHAFSEMERIRNLDIPLTVCIDVVAASGGYLMSLPANKIVAAPFAVVGSVGVVAFVPNVRKFLTDHHINPRTFTAGKYKRTVTLTDDASPEEVERFQQQLETIHRLFINAVKKYRRDANLGEVETGMHWTASESLALGLGLVDELGTSSDYLLRQNRYRDLVFISAKKGFFEDGFNLFADLALGKIESRIRRISQAN